MCWRGTSRAEPGSNEGRGAPARSPPQSRIALTVVADPMQVSLFCPASLPSLVRKSLIGAAIAEFWTGCDVLHARMLHPAAALFSASGFVEAVSSLCRSFGAFGIRSGVICPFGDLLASAFPTCAPHGSWPCNSSVKLRFCGSPEAPELGGSAVADRVPIESRMQYHEQSTCQTLAVPVRRSLTECSHISEAIWPDP